MTYHTELFDRLPEEKQQRILHGATDEFSRLGFKSANINIIADKCGVSVGALYKYFGTKENLFLSVCSQAVEQISESFESLEASGGDFFVKIERLLRFIQEHSRRYGQLVNLYNEITTEANNELASRLSYQVESLSARYYRGLLDQAQKEGVISSSVDTGVAAFCLDSLFMTLQFSYASEYYRDRMKIYISETIFDDDERIVKGLLAFIENALRPRD